MEKIESCVCGAEKSVTDIKPVDDILRASELERVGIPCQEDKIIHGFKVMCDCGWDTMVYKDKDLAVFAWNNMMSGLKYAYEKWGR